MKRGGYDSYGPDEALERARERGENVSRDRLFRAAGAVANGFWLLVLAAFALPAAWLAGDALRSMSPIALGLIVTFIAMMIAAPATGWLVAPYPASIFRRLLWGLTAAALALLLVHITLAVALRSLQWSGLFTLVIAVLLCPFCVIWGWLGSRSRQQDRAARLWRYAPPILLVLGMAILLWREGVYFQGLKFES